MIWLARCAAVSKSLAAAAGADEYAVLLIGDASMDSDETLTCQSDGDAADVAERACKSTRRELEKPLAEDS
jgi:hypothetical protein